jgi:hypothetical protein
MSPANLPWCIGGHTMSPANLPWCIGGHTMFPANLPWCLGGHTMNCLVVKLFTHGGSYFVNSLFHWFTTRYIEKLSHYIMDTVWDYLKVFFHYHKI